MDTIIKFFTDWGNTLYSTFIEDGYYKYIIEGIGNTLIITLGALVIGFVIGVVIAITKYSASKNKKLKFLDVICNLYLTLIRGTPVTVQLMISFFIIFATSQNGVMVAMLTFGINSGAYTAEIIRSGIMSIDGGQTEAGRSLGLSSTQTMVTIVMPQAIKNILPAIGNEMIALLKETSVAGYLAVRDITKAGQLIQSQTYDPINPILLVALIYLVLVIGLSKILNKFERKYRKSDKR
ncbi:MAG: amino acid ABC transporter permease [Clostridia bacterium]